MEKVRSAQHWISVTTKEVRCFQKAEIKSQTNREFLFIVCTVHCHFFGLLKIFMLGLNA